LRPAFSLEHLHSHPYIVHLVAFRTSLLREVGGWNESLLISQDYDLIVRVAERARKIVHVPEILYRWRNHGTSAGHARQGQVVEASLGLLRQHLERTGRPGRVEEGASFNFYSVRYALGEGLRVGIVIPTKNHGDLLRQCIDSLRATIGKVAYDILVVDHESDDPGTLDYLASLSGQARVVRFSGPFNFAAINNFAVKQLGAGYSHYLLCNNDIEAYEHGWLERMVELAQQPDAGIVGAMLFYPDRKTIQHAGVCIGMSRGAEHYGKFLRYPEDTSGLSRELLSMTREVAAVTAACMLVRGDAWEEVGGFDEKIAVGYGDVDLCLRVVESGRRVLFCASARLIHHESFTRGTSEFDPHPVDTSAFREKWKRLLEAGDPYYSPAFSLNSRRWEIRRPLPCQVEVRRRVVERDPEGRRNRIAFSPSI
ncbi:MAG TPA: glycosyltransferase family 2 protein, partial [Usitatibacter sp.]|nr:glycosyltransferase family 2 protein [Usitatibacter sp.]